MFNQKRVILFDFDGTLIDSVPDLAAAVNHMLETLGYVRFEIDQIRVWIGNGARTLVERALKASDADVEKEIDRALTIFLEYYGRNLAVDTIAYPGVDETLEHLHRAGFQMGIVTNKPEAFVQPILQHLGLEKYFTHIVGGDTLSVRKPHAQPLLHICDLLGVECHDAVMIGDSRNDILAAKAASMHSIGVAYGYNYDESIEDYEPDLVCDSFASLMEPFGVAHA